MPSKEPRRRDANAAARAAKAMQLRILGYGFQQIATECGYSDKASAYNAVKRELARTVQQPADELRTLEADRLDALLRTFLPKALKGDTWSCDRVLAIMDRRAKLLALDVPADAVPVGLAQVRVIMRGERPALEALTDASAD